MSSLTLELLAESYASALRDYLGGAGEQALASAYEIGRAAIDDRLGLLDMASIHRQALKTVLDEREGTAGDAEQATTFLVESLAAYEMAQEGYRVTSARLLETKKELEQGAADLAVTNEALQSEVAQRTIAEENARQSQTEAERANRSKSEFLSRMSHELRTPLNSILGFGQVLEMGDLDPDQSESVAQIIAGGRHLLGLIDEILDISRIETGRMALSVEPVPLKQVVGEAVEMVSPIAAAREIHVTIDGGDLGDIHVAGDHQRLTQALLNLLSNAVKYNEEGGVVHVSLSREDDRLSIRVRDSGVGIPEEKLERVFQPFDRLGAEMTDVEGTGLGLALSKRMLEAMGGDLHVEESRVGVGTTFAIELPVAEDPLERLDTDTTMDFPEATRVSGLIVYVEDNLANLRLIERVLDHRPGVDLVPATRGSVGLELIHKLKPNLVLLDLHLPDLSGTEVLRLLKEDPLTADIPVIVLSADAMTEQRRTTLEAGAHEYLTKPVEVAELLRALDDILPSSPPPAVA